MDDLMLPPQFYMDDLGGLVPSEVRVLVREYAKKAVEVEREACAEVANSMDPLQDGAIAAAIRARR